MIAKAIQLPGSVVKELFAQAQAVPDQEICGLIARDGECYECYPIENVAIDASVLFALNASEQLAAFKQMQQNGQSLFAIYHSHPRSAAVPSTTDIAEANYPEALYLIISLQDQNKPEMRGFYVNDHKIEEVELIL